MPIKVSSCGRIWLLGPDGVHFRELTLIEASLHLEKTQHEMTRANELRKVEQEEAAKQQRLALEAAQKEIDVQQEELKGTLLQAEKKLQGLDVGTERFRSQEGGQVARKENMEESISREQNLVQEQIRQERLELTEMMSVLRLEKECLDRDRTKLANKERQNQEQIEQIRLAQELLETELRKREVDLQTQHEALEKERLEFELLKITQGEEARKANAEILERDRITQETEARDREVLRVAVAKLLGEYTIQSQQATLNLELKELRARADKLKEDEVKVAVAIEKRAAAEQKVEEMKALLAKVDKEFMSYREEAWAKIDGLIAEHEVKDTANRVELKKALEIAKAKTQELQDLRTLLVEEDPKRAREKTCSAGSSQKNENSAGVKKRSKIKDLKSSEVATVKPSHENESSKKVEDKPADGNESVSQKSTDITNSPTMDDFVFIIPESTSP